MPYTYVCDLSVRSRFVLNLVPLSSWNPKRYWTSMHDDFLKNGTLNLHPCSVTRYKTLCALWDGCVSILRNFSMVPFYSILVWWLFNTKICAKNHCLNIYSIPFWCLIRTNQTTTIYMMKKHENASQSASRFRFWSKL